MDFVFDRLYRVFRFFLDHVIGNAAIIAMLAATGLAIAEVFRRYVFGDVFAWGQDAVTYGLVGSIFLYFAVTQARRSHLRISFVTDAMESAGLSKLVLLLRALISALSVALYSAFAYWGISAVERSMLMERTTQSMVIYIWPFQAALVAAMVLMAIVAFFQLYQDIRGLFGKQVFDWAPVEEGIDI